MPWCNTRLLNRVDSLSLSTERDGFAKPKLWAPAPSQRLLKLKSASSSVPSNYVTEPVADPAMMAIRVDNLSWAAERAGSDKPKHGPPVLNQRSLKIARKVCCSDSDMDSRRLQLLETSERRQLKCVRFEPNFHGGPAVMSDLA